MAEKGVRVRIISESVGKGFKDAQSSLKKLAGAAGIGLSTAAMINFGKESVKAFAENEKSAKRLAGVVRNLGLELETPTIEASLDRISAKYGYQGEVLREAYQKLITATGSLEKSQELLNLSLDIAAGSGQDLVTVNQDLANLFIGNTKGLKKYNLGLSNAQLKTVKFEDAVALLSKTFKNASEDELDTYSGQMRVLGEAAGNAQEIIGGGLIDALMILAGDTTVEDLASTMADLATNTADALTNLGKFGRGVVDTFAPIATALEKFILATDPFVDLIVEGDPSGFMSKPKARARRFFTGGQDSVEEAKRAKARAVAEAEALKRAKERANLEKKAAIEAKKKAAFEKAARTLELERINIAAALKGKLSETDKLSLNLQLALLDKNDQLAATLAAKLEAAVKANVQLQKDLLATPEAPNPYRNWLPPEFGKPLPEGFTPPKYPEPAPNPQGPKAYVPPMVPDFPSDSFKQYGPQGGLGAGVVAGVNPQINVTVELDGQTIGGAIRDSSINDSLSGSFNTVSRSRNKGAVAFE